MYRFMFLSVHMLIVENISEKVMEEATGIYHDMAAEKLKQKGNVMPIFILEEL